VKGTCSGRLAALRDKPFKFSMRNMLSVNDNDVIEAAATGKELEGIPEDLLSAAAFLNDDGTLVDSPSVDTTVATVSATEGAAAAPAAGVDASSSRRLKTWGRHNDKDEKDIDKDNDKDYDKECPRGWLNSKRNCDVTGCGTCCVRISKQASH
jgi:hypothetical protein